MGRAVDSRHDLRIRDLHPDGEQSAQSLTASRIALWRARPGLARERPGHRSLPDTALCRASALKSKRLRTDMRSTESAKLYAATLCSKTATIRFEVAAFAILNCSNSVKLGRNARFSWDFAPRAARRHGLGDAEPADLAPRRRAACAKSNIVFGFVIMRKSAMRRRARRQDGRAREARGSVCTRNAWK